MKLATYKKLNKKKNCVNGIKYGLNDQIIRTSFTLPCVFVQTSTPSVDDNCLKTELQVSTQRRIHTLQVKQKLAKTKPFFNPFESFKLCKYYVFSRNVITVAFF